MARIKLAVITSADIMKLEGLIQTLTDTDAKFRPKSTSIDYIAAQLGVSSRVVREWVRNARPMSRRTAIMNLFFSAYEKISDLLVEQLESAVYTTATTAGGRDQMKAALFLLPRVHPERYGEVPPDETDDVDVLNIADVEQEVFDEMSDDDAEWFDRAQQKIVEIQENAQKRIQEKRAKILARAITEDRVH